MDQSATSRFPDKITSVAQLDDLLSEPSEAAVAAVARLEGDILLLGVGGKMGPTLARMARRASDLAGVRRRIIGVSRFTHGGLAEQLEQHGVETLACDLLDPKQLDQLPDIPNVVFLAGMKFGATGNEPLTWLMNVHLPGLVCRKFDRSRIVAFSSGNVYGLSPVVRGGSVETDTPAPAGEYAWTVLGRERTFAYFSREAGTPTVLLRLNYANELRYGVLVDLAQAVWKEEPIDLTMGSFNVLWQGDANAAALAAFDCVASPARVLNLAGPELLSVRRVAEQFGQLLNKPVTLTNSEATDALLNNGQLAHQLFGYPRIGPRQMIAWIADWVRRGGETHNKPTHFENRAGDF
jgi:nucleoside-diphosphate-sugar epimerase